MESSNDPKKADSLLEDDSFVDLADAVEQPTRTGKKRPPRRFDRTQLREHGHGKRVHRDYLAHVMRWGWVARHIRQNARILDVGAGQDLPLMQVLSGAQNLVPSFYLGCDLNRLEDPPFRGWAKILSEFNFVDDYLKIEETEKFDYVVNFEVLEHVSPADQPRLLTALRHWTKDDGQLFLSTPVFNGKAAVNHIRELTIEELTKMFEETGWEVKARYGTFASVKDVLAVAKEDELAVWKRLEDFLGNDVLSCFLAPLYPDQSRNNLWCCTKKG
jgi:SAM-dependent methyltransferase